MSRLFIESGVVSPEKNDSNLIVGHEYDIKYDNGIGQPGCIYVGKRDFHQIATCGGIFTLTPSDMENSEFTDRRGKYHTFNIVYRTGGMGSFKTERIESRDHATATEICKCKGESINVEYVPDNTDLLYIH